MKPMILDKNFSKARRIIKKPPLTEGKHGDVFTIVLFLPQVVNGKREGGLRCKLDILKDVFEEDSIKHIDYMSIDVEGYEFNVIKGIDLDETRINVLTIENNSPGYRINGDDKINLHMFENNYALWGRIVELDDIYVHKEF